MACDLNEEHLFTAIKLRKVFFTSRPEGLHSHKNTAQAASGPLPKSDNRRMTARLHHITYAFPFPTKETGSRHNDVYIPNKQKQMLTLPKDYRGWNK